MGRVANPSVTGTRHLMAALKALGLGLWLEVIWLWYVFFILTEPDVVLTVLPSFLVDLVIVLLSECQAIKKLCSYICIHPFCHHHGGLFEHGFTGMRSGCE